MNPLIKFVLLATVAVTLLLCGAGALLAYGLFHSGTVHVAVLDASPGNTVDIDLPIPAGLVAGLLDLAAIADLSDHHHSRHFLRLHPWRPAARAACDALAKGPDGLLVDIAGGAGGAGGDETVRISKTADTLDIRVQGPRTDVHITAPAGLLRHLANIV